VSKTDHLARARDYIAKGDDFYLKAGQEIVAWLDEDASRTHAQAATALGKSASYVDRLVRVARDESVTGEVTQPEWASGSNKRDEVTRTTLAKADDKQVKEIVAALPVEAVERVMHAATSDLGRRDRPVRESRPVGKSLFQRFADHCFAGWKLQDEMQDSPPPAGDELVRFRQVAEANLAFAQVILRWLETGDFDAEVAELLAEARESA
jgi:hypothetical protein